MPFSLDVLTSMLIYYTDDFVHDFKVDMFKQLNVPEFLIYPLFVICCRIKLLLASRVLASRACQ
jgi:hypothetical protein